MRAEIASKTTDSDVGSFDAYRARAPTATKLRKALCLDSDDRLRRMADRIQARAIRRCGELMKQIEPGRGKHWESKRDGTVPTTRESVATDAGLSERQRKTALRVDIYR